MLDPEKNRDVLHDDKDHHRHHRSRSNHFLGITFQTTYHVLLRIICLCTLLVQSAILDYYVIAYKENLVWCLWAIPDVIVFLAFLYTAVRSYRYLKPRPAPNKQSWLRSHAGELPMTYVTWFLYSGVLCSKIWILYETPDRIAAVKLIEKDFFGPNMLKTAISLSSIVFYVFVLSSHDAKGRSSQSEFIACIVGTVYLDLLDTTQFLSVLHDDPELTKYTLLHVVLVIFTFNFLMPTEALFILSQSHFGKFPKSQRFQFWHKTLFMLAYNFPFFIIRLTVWHLHDQNISVFLIKNVMVLGLAVKDIHEFALEMSEVVTVHHSHHDAGDHEKTQEMTEINLIDGKSKAEDALEDVEVRPDDEKSALRKI